MNSDEPDEIVDVEDDGEPPATAGPPRRRDPVLDLAKQEFRTFFATNSSSTFYERQLQVKWESRFFHWITARALNELAREGHIAAENQLLPGIGVIRFFRSREHRYWKRQAAEILELVREFSHSDFTRALGQHGEGMFDAALPRGGFMPRGNNVRSYGGRTWTATGHDLDRVFEADGIAYGVEIKNTLSYIPFNELSLKAKICQFLGLRPLFIVRASPKHYIEFIRRIGGFTLVFGFQLYPFGSQQLAHRVRDRLSLPVDTPSRIADGTIQRLVNWHKRQHPP